MELCERIRAAVAAHRRGELDIAEAGYRAILAESPDQPDALHFLGLVMHEHGDPEGAIELIRRSIAASPANAAAHNNLGNVLKTVDRVAEAAESYMAAIRLDAQHADSWNNLGLLLRRARRTDKAVAVFREAVRIAPGHAEAWHNLAMTLLMASRTEEAADAFETCLDLGERRWSDPIWLATILAALGRHDRAAAALERHLAAHPGDPLATHQLAALRGRPPDRAPDDYVRRHFDGFAKDFDEVLGWLDYRAPRLVAEAVARRARDGRTFADVVDLGCGTGLCGPLVRQLCGRLTGVDLSPGMLARARQREVYDTLAECEIVAFLRRATPMRFDLALCVDTLCYFGALEPVMEALGRALKPGGAMIATVERLADGLRDGAGPGYRIGPSGRYAHSEADLRAAVGRAGLALASAEPVVLRNELDREVEGLLFTVENPAT
jgi:predicted TPR repeat methyltransferase